MSRSRIFALLLSCTCAAIAVFGAASSKAATNEGGAKKLTIGVVVLSFTDPNLVQFSKGIAKQGKKYGYSVSQADSNADPARANSLMQIFVNKRVDAIVVGAFDPASLKAGIVAANAAKIPVYSYLTFGRPKGITGVLSQIAAVQQTERMVKDLGGKGSVLAFTFHPGQPCVYAETAFDQILKKTPAIKIQKVEVKVPGAIQGGQVATAAFLRSHPAGSGPLAVWGCWDNPNLGAVAALNEASRADVKVYGDYGEAGALQLIKKKQYTATWFFDSSQQGQKIVDLIRADSKKSKVTPTYVNATPIMVDQTNIDQFLATHPNAIK